MPRSYKALGFLLVTMLGLYGCAKAPTEAPAKDTPATIAKVQKLEDDNRIAVISREQLRQKLAAAEEQHAKAQAQLTNQLEETRARAAAERDALKGEIKARTSERDALSAQFEAFRKHLKELLGSADNAVGALNLPAPKPSADQGAQK